MILKTKWENLCFLVGCSLLVWLDWFVFLPRFSLFVASKSYSYPNGFLPFLIPCKLNNSSCPADKNWAFFFGYKIIFLFILHLSSKVSCSGILVPTEHSLIFDATIAFSDFRNLITNHDFIYSNVSAQSPLRRVSCFKFHVICCHGSISVRIFPSPFRWECFLLVQTPVERLLLNVIWHGSCVVVTCAYICRDLIGSNWIAAIRIWIGSKENVSENCPWICNCGRARHAIYQFIHNMYALRGKRIASHSGTLLLTWFNFNPNMEE